MAQIYIDNISKKIDNRYIFKDVNIQLSDSKVYVLIGKNGAGKSTFLKSLLGLTPISEGKIYYDSVEMNIPYKKNLRKKFFYMPDIPVFLDYLTGYENLQYMNELYESDKEGEQLCEILKKYDLYECKDVLYRNYSKGMKQKLSFAVNELCDFNIWIMDEPTDGLDKSMIIKMEEEITKAKKDKIIVISTHDMNFCNNIADTILCIDETEIKISTI